MKQLENFQVHLKDVTLNRKLQVRVLGEDPVTVREYAEAMKNGEKFPPIRLFRVKKKLLLVDGWHRFKAAELLGLTEIQAEVTEGTEKDALHYARFEANRKNGQRLSRADKQALCESLLQDPDLSAFSDKALSKLAGVTHPTIAAARKRLGQRKPEFTVGADGKTRQYDFGGSEEGEASGQKELSFRLENRDGLGQLRELPDESVRLVLTDPPYLIAHIGPTGGAYKHFDTETSFTLEQLEEFVQEWFRVLVPGGTLICWFDTYKLGELRGMVERAGFGTRCRVIRWVKDVGNQLEVKHTYVGWGESALVVSKPPTARIVFNNLDEEGKAIPHRGLFHAKVPRGTYRTHPTQKSVELFRELIQLHSNPGDTVLDSFSGSGVTAVAASLEGRSFVGAELDEVYFERAKARVLKVGTSLCDTEGD